MQTVRWTIVLAVGVGIPSLLACAGAGGDIQPVAGADEEPLLLGRAEPVPAAPAQTKGGDRKTAFYNGLPDWTKQKFGGSFPTSSLSRDDRLSPAYLEGDLDGDGAKDVAVQIRTTKGAFGVAILPTGSSGPVIIGSYTDPGDMKWANTWELVTDVNTRLILEGPPQGGGISHVCVIQADPSGLMSSDCFELEGE